MDGGFFYKKRIFSKSTLLLAYERGTHANLRLVLAASRLGSPRLEREPPFGFATCAAALLAAGVASDRDWPASACLWSNSTSAWTPRHGRRSSDVSKGSTTTLRRSERYLSTRSSQTVTVITAPQAHPPRASFSIDFVKHLTFEL